MCPHCFMSFLLACNEASVIGRFVPFAGRWKVVWGVTAVVALGGFVFGVIEY